MRLLITIILLFSTVASYGETINPVAEADSSKHSLQIELAGRTFVFSSVLYEYALWDQFSLGAGLGILFLDTGEIIRDNNGMVESGNYFDMSTTQMLYGTYFIGKRQHKLLLTGGITNFLQTYRNRYPTEVVSGANAQQGWNAGVGYQFTKDQTFFRATGYLLAFPEPSEFLPQYLPWIGISGGIKL
ncbi:MAG: hypothetical protein AAFQ98_00425 [Bacteroidota bacterium]